MRAIFLFFLGLILGACSTVPAAGLPPSITSSRVEMASDLASKTVALVLTKETGEVRAYCSGVWVSPRMILTANHCVSDSDLGDVVSYVVKSDVFIPGTAQEADPIATRTAQLASRDAINDLALLLASSPPTHSWGIVAPANPQVGMFVQTMGHPLGLFWSYSSGDVAALRMVDGTLYVQVTAPISPGNSGGALFDVEGRIVGICHATYPRGQNMNLFIHPSYITAFLGVRP